MTTCVHDVDERACAVCRGLVESSTSVHVGPGFSARYPGACRVCHHRFDSGEEIRARLTHSEVIGYQHAGC